MKVRIVALLVTLAIWTSTAPPAADAQKAVGVPRIGVLAPGYPPPSPHPHLAAFRQGLRDLGYVEGQTIVLEIRWDEMNPARWGDLAGDLVRLKVDIIVATTTPATLAAKRATSTIPIVMAATGTDPVKLGLIASLARPAGNITGLTLLGTDLSGKRLELVKESIPAVSRVAVLWNPGPLGTTALENTKVAARSLGLELQPLQVRGPDDLDGAFRAATQARAGALIMTQDALFTIHGVRIAGLALRSRLPTISGETGFAEAGGLMNYGTSIVESWRRAAIYVDKILKGAKPGDLPVEQPTKFELVINMKTAKALGLTIPQSILIRADRVIE